MKIMMKQLALLFDDDNHDNKNDNDDNKNIIDGGVSTVQGNDRGQPTTTSCDMVSYLVLSKSYL